VSLTEFPVLDLLLQYGLFLAKTMTVVVAALIVISPTAHREAETAKAHRG